MAISEQVEQMERSELEELAVSQFECLQQFEERLDEVEQTARNAHETAHEANGRVDDIKGELNQRTPVTMNGDDIKTLGVGSKDDGNYVPLGRIISGTRNDVTDIEDRVYALEQDEVDVSDIIDGTDSDYQLPIQQATDARKKDVHDFAGNKLRATYVWPKFNKRSKPDGSTLTLYSWQVKQILDDNDRDTNPNTVRRTMQFLAKLTSDKPKDDRDPKDGDNLVTFHNEGAENTLVADKDEWEEFFSTQIDASLGGADAAESGEDTTADDATESVAEDVVDEADALMAASAVTTSSDDDIEDEAGIEVTR